MGDNCVPGEHAEGKASDGPVCYHGPIAAVGGDPCSGAVASNGVVGQIQPHTAVDGESVTVTIEVASQDGVRRDRGTAAEVRCVRPAGTGQQAGEGNECEKSQQGSSHLGPEATSGPARCQANLDHRGGRTA